MAVNTARVQKLRKRQIDGQSLKRLVESGMIWLRTNQQIVNSLNVFPVPDGDTGTNMSLTLTAAYNEIKDSGEKHLGKMANLVAKGAEQQSGIGANWVSNNAGWGAGTRGLAHVGLSAYMSSL